MNYKFIDDKGTFVTDSAQSLNTYFPLVDAKGSILSAISANLSGDIKTDNEHFLTPPASIEDLRSNYLSRREFFIRLNKRVIRLSDLKAKLTAGFLYHKLSKDISGLNIEVTNFVPHDTGVEVMWVKIRNNSAKPVTIEATSFQPIYARSEKNMRDHRHVSSLLNRIQLHKYGTMVKPTMVFDESGHKINKSIYFVLGFQDDAILPLGQFPTLDYFYGNSDINRPDAVYGLVKPALKYEPAFDGKEACGAFRFRRKTLGRHGEVNYFIIMGISSDKQKIMNIFKRLSSRKKVNLSLEAAKKYWLGLLGATEIDFNGRDYNNWLLWVKLQPTLRRLFGCSFLPHFDYGKGGRGWRDLWQDALALLLTEPAAAKEVMLKSFAGIRADGSNATIITKKGDFISDRNRINRVWMDHGVWPYLTCRLYINKTNDLNMLLKEVAYFKDHQIKRAREIDKGFTQKDNILRDVKGRVYYGSVLEHILLQTLVQFFNVGRHNIIRLENADWNDGLDMAPNNGESVTFSFMYAHNLKDICVFLNKLNKKSRSIRVFKELKILLDRIAGPIDYNDYRLKQRLLNKYLDASANISGQKTDILIDDLINDLEYKAGHLGNWLRKNEWLKEGFFNGYYDEDSKRVEGGRGSNVRMMLAPQVFAIMSGVADEAQIKKIWVSLNKYLRSKDCRGFRLNTDFGKVYTKLGRAFGFSYGDKENGAYFSHMAIMLANAFYKRGYVKEGFEVMDSLYRMASNDKAKIYPVLPEYFNSEGRGLYLYLTGSASWYIYTIIEQVLGVNFSFGDIVLRPMLLAQNFIKGKKIKLGLSLYNKKVNIEYTAISRKAALKIRKVIVNGEKLTSRGASFIISRDKLVKDNNLIKVYLS
ncbi:MAG: cellobiose phosphorylase [Candidatus Omnitrophota bacterium]|jgi:cellobiose phosphorylase|nr:MAG: cellobiose phosphorylase [Candidatus Omnitrophota bacterium]